jgi:hypothetical protein
LCKLEPFEINKGCRRKVLRKVYFDVSEDNSCYSVFVKGAEAVPAGTTVYSMSVKHNCEEYENIAEQLDIYFIFDDDIPKVNFYTVPRVDIFAVSSAGGFLGTIGTITDIEGSSKICYINKNRKCFTIAENLKELLVSPDWKENMKPAEEIWMFNTLGEAKENLEFIECRGYHEK